MAHSILPLAYNCRRRSFWLQDLQDRTSQSWRTCAFCSLEIVSNFYKVQLWFVRLPTFPAWHARLVSFFIFAAQVGKTSLVLSLVGEEFPEEVCEKHACTWSAACILAYDYFYIVAYWYCIWCVPHLSISPLPAIFSSFSIQYTRIQLVSILFCNACSRYRSKINL